MTTKTYDVDNWYWIVGGDETQVYSSASGSFVPANDATYAAWASDGTLPTRIANKAELGAVLSQSLVRPNDATVLDGYVTAQADHVIIRTMFKLFFNHENRIRALEGKQAITAQQARAAIKAMM